MRLTWLLPLALLVWSGAARAAAFDTYQLIMWQDRTPEQMEGLKRLGFTATKLRATGGAIDEVELINHFVSDLPWYLENIATDLLSAYHRYTPGKSVTWLFEAAKARRRADPADTSVFIREPSLSDPVWLERIAARLRDVVAQQKGFHPLFYNLADEAGIGDLAAAWDADISAPSLAEFRVWLQTQYLNIAALNGEWGTSFESWDAVVPELTDAAMRRTDDNYAAWADFKAWMDVAFARAVRSGTDALHGADATALAGLEGAQLPGWGGYDYDLLAHTVDVMEIYDAGNAVEMAHAFNPGLIVLRTSFGGGAWERHAAWQNILRGGRGTIVWDEADDVVLADGSPGPRGTELAGIAASIRAVAPVLFASAPSPDPVAVLISQASFRTRWMLDHRIDGPAWSDRDAAREAEDNTWSASRRQVLGNLHGLGVEPILLSSSMLESGALAQAGAKVLILPHAIALSDREVEAITAFARGGGKVLADTEPGLFDGHGKRLMRPALAGIAAVPEAMLLHGGPATPGPLEGLAGLLREAGVVPRAVLRGPDGGQAIGLEARWFRNGDRFLLSIQRVALWAGPDRVTVTLPAAAGVRDLRAGGAPREADRIGFQLDPAEPTILEITPAGAGR